MNKKILFGLIFSGLLIVSCSPETPSLYLPPEVQKLDQQVEDPNAVYFDPRVDILFVVDNSGSMSGHQINLINNIDLFTNAFLNNKVIDYNIGVLTTDMSDCSGTSKYCDGVLVDKGGYTFVNRKTPNASSVLKSNLNLGISGSGTEMLFDPVYFALTKHINTINKGFYRDAATLVVIFVTDTEDQSRRNTSLTMKSFLLGLKNYDTKKIITVGVIVPSNVNSSNCSRDDGEPYEIENLLSIFPLPNQNNILSLCSKSYGVELSEIAISIVKEIGNVLKLKRIPIFESIRVTYGAIDLPNDKDKGWSFVAKTNEISLGDNIDWSSQPPGSRIQIFYNAAPLDIK